MQRKINKRKENSHKILFLSIVIKYQWQTREIYFSLKSFLPQLCSVVAESFHCSDPRRPRKAINKYEDCKFYNDDIVTLITLPTLKTKNYVLTMTHGDETTTQTILQSGTTTAIILTWEFPESWPDWYTDYMMVSAPCLTSKTTWLQLMCCNFLQFDPGLDKNL